MHYKNGRAAKVGDRIVGRDVGGNPVAGIIVALYAGSTTCNAQVISTQAPQWSITLGECEHVDDAFPKPPPTAM